ncbi:FAD-dependent oxidoreductase [Urbifossiella limnaea]|uniref:Gamma-glutamylputrescine oxidoreductase n=1 Tax=Urbifossiella limnaea TaxID=2528023 RepID=A0A517XUN5_9BACT|nr:FAD-dependent oxidoreductase [Urbifossiella limnaea]QDU21206.1 Gamma-glutamylputrescine oxidoreductase [Urbifossiella limnaea]
MPSTSCVWQEVRDDSAYHAPVPAAADVCVIGAGIAGLSVAYSLARLGQRVVVLEARGIGSGMTSVTTAHLASVLDDRYHQLIRVRGEDAARLGVQAHAAAIDFIQETASREGIDCGFKRLDGYLVAASEKDHDLLDREADAARKLGVEFEARQVAPAFGGGHCLRFPRQARFEPMAYLGGLARAVVRLGGTIVTNARAESVEDGTPCRVKVRGGELRANAVVVATNSPFNDRFALHTKQFPYMTYVVGLRAKLSDVPDALVWDTIDPYHYVRQAGKPDAAGFDTLVVGGEDHKTGHANDGDERFARLESWARQHFPQAGEVTHRWAGQVLETLDGLGHIGRNPGDTNVHVVTGDSGMGMTHGTIAGILLPALIAAGSHPWQEVFDPGRTPLKAAGEFVQENADVALQYAAWLSGGDVSSADEVKRGCGAVVRSGLKKLAVYRSDDGKLHACSATCPHLGAVVQWNDAEKTWDCPAHGSRFDPRGKVIQGPANTPLERAELK